MKNRPRVAKGRLIVDALAGQALHDADDRPGKGEAEAQKHEQSYGNIHDGHPNHRFDGVIVKFQAFTRL